MTETVNEVAGRGEGYLFHASADDFKKIPGSPIAYWVSNDILNIFDNSYQLGERFNTRLGMSTADNDRFIRLWFEVDSSWMKNCDNQIWQKYQKGGSFKKWYGNNELLVNWAFDGRDIKSNVDENGRIRSHNYNGDYAFREGITWSDVTSSVNAFRYMPKGYLFDGRGSSGFCSTAKELFIYLALLNSKVVFGLINIINPTIAINVGEVAKIPVPHKMLDDFTITGDIAFSAVNLSKLDWDAYETSWDFTDNPLIRTQQPTLEQAFTTWQTQNSQAVAEMKRLEEENNRLFIEAYGLQDELTPDVPDEQITLTRADSEKDSQRLISYTIGCMMGRYSLDEQGLIYANAGNIGFDANRYNRFAADADGIIPITDMLWFEDDATNRLKAFLIAMWGEQTLEQNLTWLATQLGTKAGESAEDSIRRYLSDKFYKDHLQTYKKRPIYWHFSSGKQGAFQALVYLHRYNESTLARMRAEYVVPLMGKLQNRIEMTEKDASVAGSTATRNKLTKQVETLRKKHLELLAFDEKLRHYADMRITLDLDDGVRVNYGKFGDLLAEVKAVTGGKDE
jgi:hypothetical protein